MSSTAEELASQAEQLQDTIGFFNVGTSGGMTVRRSAGISAAPSGPAKTRPSVITPQPAAEHASQPDSSGGITLAMDETASDDDFEKY
jgi:methyl-accepting chemotaxis protein